MGPEAIYELEHMGLPFSRLENGKIYQRRFWWQQKILVANKPLVLVLQQIALAMHYYILYIKKILKPKRNFLMNGMPLI